MASEPTTPVYRGEYWLSLARLHELIAEGSRTFPAYRVAREILYCEPLLENRERNEMSAILLDLIEKAERKMEESGVEPRVTGDDVSRLPKRLRQEALLLGALYTYVLPNITAMEDLESLAERGAAWLHLSEDPLQAGVYWYELGKIYAGVMRHPDAAKAMQTALDHAERSGDLELQLRIIGIYGGVIVQQRRAQDAAPIIERGMRVLEENPTFERYRFHRGRLLKFLGHVHSDRREYEEAVRVLQLAGEVTDEKEDPVNSCGVHGQLAEIYQILGDYSAALHHLTLAATIAERNNRVIISGIAWSRIGRIHTELRDYDQAREAFRFAYRFVPEDHTTVRRNIMAAEIELAVKTGAGAEGIALCNRVLESLSPDDMGSHRSTTLVKLSACHALLEHYEEARRYLEQAVRVLEATGTGARQLRQAQSDLARYLIREGQTDAARTILEELKGMQAEALGDEVIRTEGLELLSEVEQLEGNFQAALRYVREAKERALDIAERRNTISIQNARVLVEIQMRQQQENIQKEQRKIAEGELAQILTMLNGIPLGTGPTEQQLHRTLSLLDSDLLQRVVAALKDVVNAGDADEARKKKRALAKVQGVKPEFFVALRKRFPELTQKQERLCGLIYSGLKTDEIAVLLAISEHGVWMQRKRLRKKLNIEKGVNLEEYLKDVGDKS